MLRTHLWLEDDGRMLFGRGRAQLLELVRLLGSLNRAAKALGMSYRAAWGRIKSTEEVLGQPLLVKGDGRRGHELTPLAERLLESFARWQSEVEAFALERASQAFPWEMQPYVEKDDAPVPVAKKTPPNVR